MFFDFERVKRDASSMDKPMQERWTEALQPSQEVRGCNSVDLLQFGQLEVGMCAEENRCTDNDDQIDSYEQNEPDSKMIYHRLTQS